jgi:hypothetical protein
MIVVRLFFLCTARRRLARRSGDFDSANKMLECEERRLDMHQTVLPLSNGCAPQDWYPLARRRDRRQ